MGELSGSRPVLYPSEFGFWWCKTCRLEDGCFQPLRIAAELQKKIDAVGLMITQTPGGWWLVMAEYLNSSRVPRWIVATYSPDRETEARERCAVLNSEAKVSEKEPINVPQ